jgi:hypothetical protein
MCDRLRVRLVAWSDQATPAKLGCTGARYFQPDFYGVGESLLLPDALEEERPVLSRPAGKVARLAWLKACGSFAAALHRLPLD